MIAMFEPLLADFNVGLFVLQMLLFLTSLFLMLLILVQRGKGGGLTGALGGSGGGSPFGAKAGDAFTRITVVVAIFWILLCIVTISFFNKPPVPTNVYGDPSAFSGESETTDDADTTDADSNDGDSNDSGADAGSPSDGISDDGTVDDGNAFDPGLGNSGESQGSDGEAGENEGDGDTENDGGN